LKAEKVSVCGCFSFDKVVVSSVTFNYPVLKRIETGKIITTFNKKTPALGIRLV